MEVEEDGGEVGEGIASLVRFTNSQGDTEAPQASTPSATGWLPPACWYEPRTPQEVRAYVRHLGSQWENEPGQVGETESELTRYYTRGRPYGDYNLDVQDEGYFWFGVMNPERVGEPEAEACSRFADWVEHDASPATERAVTPEVMAEAAYAWLPFPEPDVSLSPAAADPQVVGLPTWAWHEGEDLEPIQATATLDRLGLEATTTATPRELTLASGTDDLDLHPSDGVCLIRSDGGVGERWSTEREGETPPCGFTFLRAGDDRDLTVTVTWSVTWTGTGHDEPQPLPDATTETEYHLTVQEIQAVDR